MRSQFHHQAHAEGFIITKKEGGIMRKAIFGMLIVAVSVCFAVSGFAQTQKAPAVEKEYKGYLSDVLCGSAGKDPAGNDLLMHPEKHTLACMKADACAASGYGIIMKEKGKYAFHKFDAQGSGMAKKDIVDVSKKKAGITIKVKGELQEDGTLMVKSIKAM
jgi:hypothetical protein